MKSTQPSPQPGWTGRPPCALIAGPTASGKSRVAMACARAVMAAERRALIINADASQVYADIPILSAAPGAADRAAVPHALVGHIDGADNCNAARWASEARAVLAEAYRDGMVPIIVGGTGMYLTTLLDGIAPVPPIPDAVRGAVRAMPVADAHAALCHHDPQRAAALPAGDTTRVQRALEVVLATGRTLAAWQADDRAGGIADHVTLVPLVLLPPRAALYQRCDARLAAMLAGGAMAEVAALLARALSPDLPVMRAIGVAEVAAHLRGEATIDAALATRHYAKRQYTWLRNQTPSAWGREERELSDAVVDDIVIKLRGTLLT